MKKPTHAKKLQDAARMKSIKLAEHITGTRMFSAVIGMGDHIKAYTRKGTYTMLTREQMEAVERNPLKWNFTCYAICRDGQGRDYIKSVGLQCLSPVRRDAVAPSVSGFHYDWMEKECNPKHVLTLAWIESAGEEPSDEMAMDIFTREGVFSKFEPLMYTDDGKYLTNLAA